MKEKEILVISPVGGESIEQIATAPRLDAVEGKTVCEVWNGADRAADKLGSAVIGGREQRRRDHGF